MRRRDEAWCPCRRDFIASENAIHLGYLSALAEHGRLVLDEPTDLPEGAEVPLQVVDPDDLTDEERAALHASLERGLADLEAGRVVDHARIKEVLRATRARP